MFILLKCGQQVSTANSGWIDEDNRHNSILDMWGHVYCPNKVLLSKCKAQIILSTNLHVDEFYDLLKYKFIG